MNTEEKIDILVGEIRDKFNDTMRDANGEDWISLYNRLRNSMDEMSAVFGAKDPSPESCSKLKDLFIVSAAMSYLLAVVFVAKEDAHLSSQNKGE